MPGMTVLPEASIRSTFESRGTVASSNSPTLTTRPSRAATVPEYAGALTARPARTAGRPASAAPGQRGRLAPRRPGGPAWHQGPWRVRGPGHAIDQATGDRGWRRYAAGHAEPRTMSSTLLRAVSSRHPRRLVSWPSERPVLLPWPGECRRAPGGANRHWRPGKTVRPRPAPPSTSRREPSPANHCWHWAWPS